MSFAGNIPVSDQALQNAAGKLAGDALNIINPRASSYWVAVKRYFAVNNRYVLAKMCRVLFFGGGRGSDWRRVPADGGSAGTAAGTSNLTHALPTSDRNAPDLYLPAMSLLTYVLLAGLADGTSGKFTSETLQGVTSTCLVTWILEVAAMKVACVSISRPTSSLDLLAYCGYKFLGLCVNMVVGLCFGYKGYYLALVWTASSAVYFTHKTLECAVPKQNHVPQAGPKQEFVMLGLAGAQAVVMWFLGQTKHLS